MRILLIEDNKNLCLTIARHITKAGYNLDYTYDGLEGMAYIQKQAYDLILLDCMLPSLNGIALLKKIRFQGIHIPVIMLTALGDIDDRVNGLDAGADDYLTKPFAMEELLARIRALKRRPSKWECPENLCFKDITFDCTTKLLVGPSATCSLSKRESSLLELFLQNPNNLLPRELIFFRIWGPDAPVEESNLDNYIRFIRRRLTTVGSNLKIKTIRNVGYLLEHQNA
ncbi:MAG: response regulator transcription factor [Cellulosilyticaceae bacterium]